MKRLVIADPAARDLEAIIDYIALDNRTAAHDVFQAIMRAAEQLPHFPGLGRAGRYPETRELSVANLPYLIVYTVSTGAVIILAVFHAARDLVRVLDERLRPG